MLLIAARTAFPAVLLRLTCFMVEILPNRMPGINPEFLLLDTSNAVPGFVPREYIPHSPRRRPRSSFDSNVVIQNRWIYNKANCVRWCTSHKFKQPHYS